MRTQVAFLKSLPLLSQEIYSKPSIHTASFPAANLYEYPTICSALTLSLSTPVAVIDGFESVGFCGQLQFYSTNGSKWIFGTFY